MQLLAVLALEGVCACIHMYMCVYMCVQMYMCVCSNVHCVFICMCVYVHTLTCACVYTTTLSHTLLGTYTVMERWILNKVFLCDHHYPITSCSNGTFLLFAVILSQDETSCSDTCNVVTTPTPTTNAMSTETETDATSTTQTTPTSSLQAANCTTLGSVTVAESVCIAIATITLLFNIITIILCAVNLFVMKQIKEALPKAAAPKTPTTFNLGSPTRNAAFTPSLKTPASYGKAHHSSDVKETLPTKHQDPTDNLELQDTPITMRRDLVNLGPQNTPPIMHRDPMSSSRDNLITTIN